MKCKKLPCQSDKGKSNTQSISIVINHFLSMSNFLIRPSQRFSFELNFFGKNEASGKVSFFGVRCLTPPSKWNFQKKSWRHFFTTPKTWETLYFAKHSYYYSQYQSIYDFINITPGGRSVRSFTDQGQFVGQMKFRGTKFDDHRR